MSKLRVNGSTYDICDARDCYGYNHVTRHYLCTALVPRARGADIACSCVDHRDYAYSRTA